MSNVEHVYYMCPSCEEDRPQIDFEKHRYWDEWDELEQPFPEGVDTIGCRSMPFHVNASDALSWDWYAVPFWGAISQRARDLLWPYARKHLRCFQTTLNGAPYYLLRLDERLALDCLDRERSDLEFFKSSGRVMQVKKYVFRPGIISGPIVFFVPEKRDILCTQSIKQMVEQAGLKGFYFRDVEHLNR